MGNAGYIQGSCCNPPVLTELQNIGLWVSIFPTFFAILLQQLSATSDLVIGSLVECILRLSCFQVRGEDFPSSGEPFPILWERIERAWSKLIDYVDNEETNVAVVSSHSLILSGLLGCCLGMDRKSLPLFRYCPSCELGFYS